MGRWVCTQLQLTDITPLAVQHSGIPVQNSTSTALVTRTAELIPNAQTSHIMAKQLTAVDMADFPKCCLNYGPLISMMLA